MTEIPGFRRLPNGDYVARDNHPGAVPEAERTFTREELEDAGIIITTTGLEQIRQVVAEASDSGDEWGSVMGAAFDIADLLTILGEDVPASWEYRPGLGARTGDYDADGSYVFTVCRDLYNSGAITADDLRAVGSDLLDRREALLAAGKDY